MKILGFALFIFLSSSSIHAEESSPVVQIDKDIVTLMTIEGEALPCSKIVVNPPTTTFWTQDGNLKKINLWVETCSGATPYNGGSWDFSREDSWKGRKPLIAAIADGGKFSCSIAWSISTDSVSSVQFFSIWSVVASSKCEASVASK
jgi:hypothetical protein